ncbi:MAG: hypothetical protein HC920_16605 [Oscillatoriales cyanobacterium SM2_3_0]|nr:hypothetical protein [Oscillatoriales cyanobacterium SM2_3_0]
MFQAIAAESVLVLMDINRSQGGQVGEKVGALTMESANQLEIPTILSCRPDQLSRETSALRQGFFTSALLEALRSGKNQSVEELHQFLSHRLPELTEQHLRPQQDPVLVMHPSRKFNQSILPDSNHHNGVRSLENQEQNGSVKAASTTVLSVTQSRENSKAILDLPLSETASAVKLSESPTHPNNLRRNLHWIGLQNRHRTIE